MSRILFAIVLFIVYLVVYNSKGALHEGLAVVLGLFLCVHVYLNRRWFMNLAKGRYTTERRLMLISNVLFVICMIGAMLTGLMHGKALFPDFPMHMPVRAFKPVHHFFVYGTVLFLITHSLLHWRIIVNYSKRLIARK